MKVLTGRESSILALLAQCSNLTVKDKKRILSQLKGQSLKIANVILGGKNTSSITKAANGFLNWANKLPGDKNMSKSTMTINGKTITVSGNNISIIGDKIIVDGKVIEEGLSGITEVVWSGPLANLTTDASVKCGDINGNAKAGGSITCENIGSNATAGGSISVNSNIQGNAKAGGSINCKTIVGNIEV
jgi:hypothetical protein